MSYFDVHFLNEQGQKKASQIRDIYVSALSDVEALVDGDSRELSLARTKLEESCFFAKKAMASRPENQD
jgi:hypothetical protein